MSTRISHHFLDYNRGVEKYLEEFRLNIKYYREQSGISQTQLSILCGCGAGTIGGIESGKAKPSFDMMIRIADALKVSPADLFVRDSSRSKSQLRECLRAEFDGILARL